MKRLGKKGIMGMALLASLSVYAGVAVGASNTNKTVNKKADCKPPQKLELKKDANGNMIAPDGTIVKIVKKEEIESLKAKLKKGAVTLTDEEAENLTQLIKPHFDGPKPDDKMNEECKLEFEKKFKGKKADKNARPRLSKEEIDSLVNSINSKKLTKEESSKLVQLLNRPERHPDIQ